MLIGLLPGESRIATWSTFYQPLGGKQYRGKLTVTNRRLLYETEFDLAAEKTLPQRMFIKWGSQGYLEIDKTEISCMKVRRNLWNSKTTLTLTDGSQHVFGHSLLGLRKIVNAINRPIGK